MLTSSGHTSTQLLWRPRQIFTLASHHIASRVEQIRRTQCVAQRNAITVGIRHDQACHTLFGPYTQCTIARSSSVRIETTSGSGLGLIPDRIQIERMHIQCGCAQTGLDLVQVSSVYMPKFCHVCHMFPHCAGKYVKPITSNRLIHVIVETMYNIKI